MIEDKLLNALKAKQQEHAVDALKRPVKCDAFEYGYRVGVMAGYEAAVEVLLKLIDEDKYGNDDI